MDIGSILKQYYNHKIEEEKAIELINKNNPADEIMELFNNGLLNSYYNIQ